ncbi:hypothetical protein [Solilutibacter silvestris]|uniref:Uncharacterized protein n=1 Tax=Solilutibacter silvestris TaxID=1645665 RepID=A0A2K1Q1X5_9GAMM|nr:hypothetical protein [Lysobacter silvestris]PNS09029.1 hypothetical protein Lysil_0658 [Lysobacter silvestris]
MDPFESFVGRRQNALKRIARATSGEHQYEDVVNEAWLMAGTISERYGLELDFADAEFQQVLISHLYQSLVRYTERIVRGAVRLDHSPSGESGGNKPNLLMNRLASNDGRDPLSHLLIDETVSTQPDDGGWHPSLAGAWIRLLRRHEGRMRYVASRLLVSIPHAYACCAKARWLATVQHPIPFDPRAMETQLGPWRRKRAIRIQRQLEFDFVEELPLRHG